MENILYENKYILISIVIFIVIGFLSYKNKENKVEEFGVKKENGNIDNDSIKKVVDEIFGKLTTPLKNNNITQNPLEEDSRVGITKWFNISSGKRDKEKFPNPNKFVYTFDSKLWNVYSVELIRLSIPRGQYTIDTHNNKMDIITNNNTRDVITLPIGFYDINTYILQLNNLFTSKGILLTATYNPILYSINFNNTGGDDYSILYDSGPDSEDSNFNELGFRREDIEISSGSSIDSNRRVDLFGTCCVDIDLREINYETTRNTVSSVLINSTALTVYENNCIASKRQLRPLKNLNQLTVEVNFTAPFKEKRLYNLNGLDFDMTLEIICVEKTPGFQAQLHRFN
jgi:hypothetical protein